MSASTSTLPPGIDGNLQFFTSGGNAAEWMPFSKRKYYTNAFIVQNGKVGLFFAQKLNGFAQPYPDSTGVQETGIWKTYVRDNCLSTPF